MYAVDRQRADVDKAPYAALGGCVYEVARTFDVGAALAINMTTEQRSTNAPPRNPLAPVMSTGDGVNETASY
jgi:hypothetical protein